MLGNGSVNSGSIAPNSIGTGQVISGVFITLTSGSIGSGVLADNSVNTNAITNSAVTNAKLQNSAITIAGASTALGASWAAQALTTASGLLAGTYYPSGALTIGLASGGITSQLIADGAVGNAELATSAVTNDKITSGTVANDKLANSAVTIAGSSTSLGGSWSAQPLNTSSGLTGGPYYPSGALTIGIATGGVVNAMIGSGAVTSGNIASGQIGTNHLASGVITALVGSGSVTSGDLGIGAVNNLNVVSGTLSNDKLTNSTVTIAGSSTALGTSWAAAALTTASGLLAGTYYPSGSLTIGIASGGITSQLLADGAVASGDIAIAAVNNQNINSGTVANDKLANSAVTIAGSSTALGGSWAAAALTAASGLSAVTYYPSGAAVIGIASGGIVAQMMGSGAITSGAIASGQIGANHLASGAVTATIGSGAVQSGMLGLNSVNSINISSGAVVSGDIGNAAVTSGSIASGQIGSSHLQSGLLVVNNVRVIQGVTGAIPYPIMMSNAGVTSGTTSINTSNVDLNYYPDYSTLTLFGTSLLKVAPGLGGDVCIGANTPLYVSGTLGNDSNVFIGSLAGTFASGKISKSNVGIGSESLKSCATTDNNTAVGESSLKDITSGRNNVAIGSEAGVGVTGGVDNTFVGANTAINMSTVTPSRSTFLGANAGFSLTGTGVTNSIGVGYAAQPELSNQTVIGNSGTTNARIWGYANFPYGLNITNATGASSGVTRAYINSGGQIFAQILSGSISSGLIISGNLATNSIGPGNVSPGILVPQNFASGSLQLTTYLYPNNARLSLASGNPLPSANTTSGGTVYLVPYLGNQISIYNTATKNWQIQLLSGQVQLAANISAGQVKDIFVTSSGQLSSGGGIITMEYGTAWSASGLRVDPLFLQDGIYVKSGDFSRRYMGTAAVLPASGSILASGIASGQAGINNILKDEPRNRLLFNVNWQERYLYSQYLPAGGVINLGGSDYIQNLNSVYFVQGIQGLAVNFGGSSTQRANGTNTITSIGSAPALLFGICSGSNPTPLNPFNQKAQEDFNATTVTPNKYFNLPTSVYYVEDIGVSRFFHQIYSSNVGASPAYLAEDIVTATILG
jgi:hypothetical protein